MLGAPSRLRVIVHENRELAIAVRLQSGTDGGDVTKATSKFHKNNSDKCGACFADLDLRSISRAAPGGAASVSDILMKESA